MSAVYEQKATEVYDVFYRGRGKDFGAEAQAVAAVILKLSPGSRSLLDAACGTGEHLQVFARYFGDVAGFDASPTMCARARWKQPGVQISECDIRQFDLARTFDSACCLTSTLGYMSSSQELCDAISSMARHVISGGVVVIDPWWTPHQFIDGYIAHDLVRDDSRTIARLSRASRLGLTVRSEAHYVMADDNGIEHFIHNQDLTLFTREQYLSAIEQADCAASHIAHPDFADRGLFIGIRRS